MGSVDFLGRCSPGSHLKSSKIEHCGTGCKKYNDVEPPEKVIKVPSKTNNAFNSAMITMMASFLPVIVDKKNKQTEKNMPFISVSY